MNISNSIQSVYFSLISFRFCSGQSLRAYKMSENSLSPSYQPTTEPTLYPTITPTISTSIPTYSPTFNNSGKLRASVIFGIVIASLLGVIILASLIYYLIFLERKRRLYRLFQRYRRDPPRTIYDPLIGGGSGGEGGGNDDVAEVI